MFKIHYCHIYSYHKLKEQQRRLEAIERVSLSIFVKTFKKLNLVFLKSSLKFLLTKFDFIYRI